MTMTDRSQQIRWATFGMIAAIATMAFIVLLVLITHAHDRSMLNACLDIGNQWVNGACING